MSNSVVIGSQWGDEGKAKVIDYLTKDSDLIIRYQGGANAGHTVVVDGKKFVFHMVPSGIMYPKKECLIGNGVVFDAPQFLKEIDELKEKGFAVEEQLFISSLAHLVLPYHKIVDKAREAYRAQGGKIGTTGRGIGPTYADKVGRSGIRLGDLLTPAVFEEKLRRNYDEKKDLVEQFYKQDFPLDFDEMLAEYRQISRRLAPFIIDTAAHIFAAAQAGKVLLFEGAQGTFLDIDHGTFPFVTSSNTTLGAIATGSGVSPRIVSDVIGIVKTYVTRVGNGPFPTELTDETGEKLQKQGGEMGATTGRPRRCGWFDAVLLRKAVQLNGFTTFALTKLDVLTGFSEIKICTHYEVDGKKTEQYPALTEEVERAKPIYEIMPGWTEDISSCRSFSELPSAAKNYVLRLQELCYNVPISLVSVGPGRDETILMPTK
ncbi:adenylosuccinate synthase [Chitinivibrio alkaliphilus]|uniref:Adenylosuccinate synthetase n=1 Tax=Chitinivibrio alkaliphilus ACht1 TaxID=1313304 RepID=U7D9I3_9BACT|nr:adenylosuccinate synthase [Chitinivibrio alkaliphilus]ERP31070.1 adenylosuccinate synthetase [Chitinivibrio alkaliphilus ACht1]